MAGLNEPPRRAVCVVVHGVVQGVGFRWFVRERARTLNLAGWVRNRADGAVEFEAEGATADINAFLAQVKVGPPRARVDRMEVDERRSPVDLPPIFDIRR